MPLIISTKAVVATGMQDLPVVVEYVMLFNQVTATVVELADSYTRIREVIKGLRRESLTCFMGFCM